MYITTVKINKWSGFLPKSAKGQILGQIWRLWPKIDNSRVRMTTTAAFTPKLTENCWKHSFWGLFSGYAHFGPLGIKIWSHWLYIHHVWRFWGIWAARALTCMLGGFIRRKRLLKSKKQSVECKNGRNSNYRGFFWEAERAQTGKCHN